MVLDKNPNQILGNDLSIIEDVFSEKGPNIILCSKPFLKSEFLNRLVNSCSIPIIILDFDLMYSGYIFSGLVKTKENVTVFRSSRRDWEKDLKEIITKISKERMLVIVDSLNGLYNSFDEIESARLINSSLMLLANIARSTESIIISTAMVIKNDHGEWILSPSGRHLVDSKKSGIFYLDMNKTSLILNSLNKSGHKEKSIEIEK